MISDIFEFLQYFIQYFNYLSNLEILLDVGSGLSRNYVSISRTNCLNVGLSLLLDRGHVQITRLRLINRTKILSVYQLLNRWITLSTFGHESTSNVVDLRNTMSNIFSSIFPGLEAFASFLAIFQLNVYWSFRTKIIPNYTL